MICDNCEERPATHLHRFTEYGPRRAYVCCQCIGCDDRCDPLEDEDSSK